MSQPRRSKKGGLMILYRLFFEEEIPCGISTCLRKKGGLITLYRLFFEEEIPCGIATRLRKKGG